MQDTVWDFALAKLTCVFSIDSVSMHSERKKLIAPWNSDIQGVKAYTNLCVIKRNFGCFQTLFVVPILFSSHAFSRKVHVLTGIEVCKHRCCLAPSQASARAEAEEVKLYSVLRKA